MARVVIHNAREHMTERSMTDARSRHQGGDPLVYPVMPYDDLRGHSQSRSKSLQEYREEEQHRKPKKILRNSWPVPRSSKNDTTEIRTEGQAEDAAPWMTASIGIQVPADGRAGVALHRRRIRQTEKVRAGTRVVNLDIARPERQTLNLS
eukprot:scaffold4270_cov166-Amphora_coffeaeformis.AAC.3